MSAVFLDFSTLSVGDLDVSGLHAAAPGLRLLEMTAQSDVAASISGCEIVMLNKLQLPREVIAGTPALKLVALSATGTNNVDLDAARDHGVAVCNITDYCTVSVVQHVLGVLLSLTQQLPQYSRDAIDGTWAQSPHFTSLVYPIRAAALWVSLATACLAEPLPMHAERLSACRSSWRNEPQAQRRRPPRSGYRWMSCSRVPMSCRCIVR
jgi:hypothetical protein